MNWYLFLDLFAFIMFITSIVTQVTLRKMVAHKIELIVQSSMSAIVLHTIMWASVTYLIARIFSFS